MSLPLAAGRNSCKKVMHLLAATLVVWASGVHGQGLPDFTVLVEKNVPAIVNVTTTFEAAQSPTPDRENLKDLLRYFQGDRQGGRAPQLQLPNPDDQQPEDGGGATGSGFIIDSNGYIITNHHVVEHAKSIKITLNDQREFEAKVVGSDKPSDLAVLKIEATMLPVVKLGNSDKLKVGEWVLAIGSPFGQQSSVAAGIISYMGRSLPTDGSNYVSYIQTDVAINPGHSGGPLLNLAGEVVGINSQIFTETGGSIGLSFAIPVDVAKNVVAQLRETGKVQRGWLGVGIDNVDQVKAKEFHLDRPHGALVNEVRKGGPAEAGGIAKDDIIVKFNSHEIRTHDDLPYFVGLIKPGAEVNVDLIRKGLPMTLHVKIGNLNDARIASKNEAITGKVGSLGLKVLGLDEKARREHELESGVVVASVRGPAQAAGLQPGDIIVSIHGIEVSSALELALLEPKLPVKRPLAILVERDNKQSYFTMRIGE